YLKRELAGLDADKRYALRAKQGVPLPFVEVRAMTPQGEVAWNGESMGELEVRGPWVAAGYHGLPEETGKWSDDGWLRTGDVVTLDEHGYVKITDRIKDLVKSGGEWISSVDLENTLMGHPKVAEAAVIAVPHEQWQERLRAGVGRQPAAGGLTAEDLLAFLAERVARWWLPDEIVFVPEIPKTSVGKF